LNHKVLDDTVKGGAFVSKALLAGCQSAEVLRRLGNGFAIETDDNTAQLLIAMCDIKVDLYNC